MPPARTIATEFEKQVRRLGLSTEEYFLSAELKSWCQDNRNRVYIPEWLLDAFWNHGRSRQRRLAAPPNQLHKTCAAKRGGGKRFIAPKAEPSALISGIAGARQSA
jgi:hypothetical protein